jgi:pimeloyl-ACP methyl ester carboxylesterase
MKYRNSLGALALVASAAHAGPASLFIDPPRDAAHPAAMEVLHIPSGAVEINGVAYLAAGKGPHPTVILCHGLPGNEKNLDLAHALRRAGWNAITFNYRGSWGSSGEFRLTQVPSDVTAVITWLRRPEVAARLRVAPERIAVAGHSMGGWAAALAAAKTPRLMGVALISAADLGARGKTPRAELVKDLAEDQESLAGTSPDRMATELADNAEAFSLVAAASALTAQPMLVLSSDDGLKPQTDALVAAVRSRGSTRVDAHHVGTDHGWSDRRVKLAELLAEWLERIDRPR